MKRRLTWRYAAALGLVAAVFITSYGVLVHRLDGNEDSAHVINIAGMQRMLSQRIALLAKGLAIPNRSERAEILRGKLIANIQRMERNHAELTGSGSSFMMSPALHEQYFGPDGIDARVSNYLANARAFLELFDEQGRVAAANSPLLAEILIEARNGFLAQLDDVVTSYELLAAEEVLWFRRLETVVLAVGLLVLVAEALLIFRPMVRRIDSSLRELADRNEELRVFAFRISHDLRAPVASSRGLVRIGREALADGEIAMAGETLERVEESMERLDSLIADIIDVTRSQRENGPPEVASIHGLVDEAIERAALLPGGGNVTMDIDVPEDAAVTTQPLFLKQIIENLISNAVKYRDESQGDCRVEVRARAADRGWQVRVADNGLGIPESHRDRLFEMFQRFHPDASFGSGLGLYLCRRNAEAIGGSLVYEPAETGSTFVLDVPELV